MLIARTSVRVVSLIIFLAVLAGGVQAQSSVRSESSWKPLKADLSRGQLFRMYAKEMANKFKGKVQPFAFPSGFRFPHDAQFDTNGNPRHDRIFGVDISHWEPKFPLGDLKKQDVSFVYMKATQGTGYKDDTFGDNWKTVAALPEEKRIPRGAFHFLSSVRNESGKDQADSFVDYVNLHGGFRAGDLPPAMDLEWDKKCETCPDGWKTNHRTPDEIVNTSLEFLNQVKVRTGRTPMIYTNKSFLADVNITNPALITKLTSGFKTWIFDLARSDLQLELPDPADNLPHVLWQFSFTGKLTNSYAKSFDTNVFEGTPEAFKATFTGSD